jgi:hypothetical protein
MIDSIVEKYMNPKKKKKKVSESSGAGTSYEVSNSWWGKKNMIFVRNDEVLFSNNHLYPIGSSMTEADRDVATMKGFVILDW